MIRRDDKESVSRTEVVWGSREQAQVKQFWQRKYAVGYDTVSAQNPSPVCFFWKVFKTIHPSNFDCAQLLLQRMSSSVDLQQASTDRPIVLTHRSGVLLLVPWKEPKTLAATAPKLGLSVTTSDPQRRSCHMLRSQAPSGRTTSLPRKDPIPRTSSLWESLVPR